MCFPQSGGNAPKWSGDLCCLWLLSTPDYIYLVVGLEMRVTEDFLGTILHMNGDLLHGGPGHWFM